MRRLTTSLAIAAALAAAFVLLGSSRSGPQPKAAGAPQAAGAPAEDEKTPQAVPARAMVVGTRDLPQTLGVTGSLRTDEDVQISSRLPGKVTEVLVKEGDRAAAGQVLVRLDDRETRAQLARARANLATATARLSLAGNQATWKDTAADETRRRAKAAVEAAAVRLQQAKTNLSLVQSETKTDVETAESGVKQAREHLAVARDVTRKQELRAAQLTVEQAQAQAAQARVQADNRRQSLERRRLLFRQDAIAKEEIEEADRQYQAAQSRVKIADAALESARQALDLAAEGSRPEEIRIFQGRLVSAERALTLARSELRRVQVAEAEIAAAEAARQQALAALKAAEAALVQHQVSQDEIAGARATAAQASADIRYLTARLTDLTLRAPVAGVVARREVHAGEMVTAGSRLLDLVASGATYFEALVPELEVHLLRPGAPAAVTIDALGGLKLAGVVREVIPVADRSSKTFRARVAVPRGKGDLPVGGFARAQLTVGVRKGAVVVPKTALQSESGEQFVWLVAVGKNGGPVARRQAVKLGLAHEGLVEVLGGLKPGRRIVAEATPAILEGVPLHLRR